MYRMGTFLDKIDLNGGMKLLIEDNALGMSTVDKEGNPHNIAIAFVQVVSEDELLITDNHFEETLENIKFNPHVSLVVWSDKWKDNFVGFELKGKAEYFEEGKWVDEIKKLPVNEGEPCKGAIIIKINKIKKLD